MWDFNQRLIRALDADVKKGVRPLFNSELMQILKSIDDDIKREDWEENATMNRNENLHGYGSR